MTSAAAAWCLGVEVVQDRETKTPATDAEMVNIRGIVNMPGRGK
jgi:hypothetical protein